MTEQDMSLWALLKFLRTQLGVCVGGAGDDNMNFKAQRVFLSLFQPAPQLLP